MFDPRGEYLDPPLQGFRLVDGEYIVIEPIGGRLPSKDLGLHLASEGQNLRLYDLATGKRLPTRLEARKSAKRSAAAAEAARQSLAEENERLRREIEAIRGL